jgi:hypothetical protein
LWATCVELIHAILHRTLLRDLSNRRQRAMAYGYDPMSYQEFAVTNDGVIFFFSQDVLLAPGAAATQVLVLCSAIDPMLA